LYTGNAEAMLAKPTRAAPSEAASRNLRTGFVLAIIFDSPTLGPFQFYGTVRSKYRRASRRDSGEPTQRDARPGGPKYRPVAQIAPPAAAESVRPFHHHSTTDTMCYTSEMPFALAALFVLLVAGTASSQPVLDEKGRVYPCLPFEPACMPPPAKTPLQPWPDPLTYRKHIPPPPFLGF
jgi:hypothetical protein